MSQYEIEKGVKVPEPELKPGRKPKYPEIFELEIDSRITIPAEETARVFSAAQRYGRKTGRKFVLRKHESDSTKACIFRVLNPKTEGVKP